MRPLLKRDRQDQPTASPDIHSHAIFAMYVATAEWDPDGLQTTPIILRIDQVWEFKSLKLIFAGVTEIGERDTPTWGIAAHILALREEERIPVEPVIDLAARRGTIVNLPGGSRLGINPNTTFEEPHNPSVPKMAFDMAGPKGRTTELHAALDVTIKPFIWLVRAGKILIVAGGFLATWRRTRNARLRRTAGRGVAMPDPMGTGRAAEGRTLVRPGR